MTEPSPNPHYLNHNGVPPPRRSTAGRAIRTNTTRPTNYYARPFGSMTAGIDPDANMADQSSQPAGFFPALTFFTDAITALPKEVMKHYTLMKEVEAKIYNPTDQLGDLIDTLMEQPVPTRKQTASAGAQVGTAQGLLSLTANNSTSGSAAASLVNGIGGRHSAQPSMAGSLDGAEAPDSEEELKRRHQYQELRMLTHSMLGNLDEKIVVLNEVNRVLAAQSMRIDSVMPHIEGEISEEARLGSMTHWAYSENRQKTKAAATGANRPRDVAATNNLAAAAAVMHEVEIAQARNDAQREAAGAGRGKGKGKRVVEAAGDSDFDDSAKPRKAPKVGKGKGTTAANITGLGISTNGEPAPVKRRKNADKAAVVAPGMERQPSTQKGAKGKDTPRSTPAIDPTAAKAKATKAKPGPPKGKKGMPGSAHNSPMLASSPLASSFNPATMEAPPGPRPQSSRLRQNSTATNLRHERVQDDESAASRPASAAGKANGNGNAEKVNGRRKAHETTEEHDDNTGDEQASVRARLTHEVSQKLKREEADNGDTTGSGNERGRPTNSRSGSDRGKNSGRGSKVGTPKTEAFPSIGSAAVARVRSTRHSRHGDRDSSSSEPQMQGTSIPKHKRNASNSHLVKQLAPFNKSPNLDRHRLDDDDDEEEDENGDVARPNEGANAEDEAEAEARRATRRSTTRRPISRRNTANSGTLMMSPAAMKDSRESSPGASPPPTSARLSTRSSGRNDHTRSENSYSAAAARMDEPPALEDDDSDDEDEVPAEPEEDLDDDAARDADQEGDDSEHDPDDPNEQKYCYCNRGSYGEMNCEKLLQRMTAGSVEIVVRDPAEQEEAVAEGVGEVPDLREAVLDPELAVALGDVLLLVDKTRDVKIG
ncbi:uncharacterized protein RHO25_009662 [Cercospora beticola]|uniref:Inhibitor of growth protein N-terminal histone-binding domain-containing protein n=1 Tax=Cercospora beticola TaxID=122368 RepID=A0ABZ0P046_CERBT|nr:hypothetical protein RHO25_009662 [Cercospora beticola]